MNFINECKNRANGNRLGKIIIDGIKTPITNSNNLQSFEIDSGCYVDGNIIGSVYAKCLKANFIDDQNNLTDKSIQAQIGVKYADLSNEYINMGKYIIEHPNNEITANMSQITAYDDLYTSLDKKYVCNIDYSSGNKTVSDLYVDVCEQLGLTPVTTTFTNSTIPITANPFENGETNRTVLQTVAKIACSFVDIDNDTNKIDLRWLSQNQEPDYIFDLNDYSSVEGGKIICGPINCLIIKNSQIDDENVTIKDEESIKLNGEHSITISEDYVLYNAELRKQAINAIWNKVKGMKYVDCKLTTYYGKPFLKLGDKIRIYTSNTEYFDTYVLKHNFTYDGTFASIIESPALTGQEIKTKQDISLGEALRNTQVEVNKQKGEIRSITTKVTKVTNTANDALQKANNGLSNVNVQYYLSTSNTTLSGGTWSDNAPSWVDGKYMWSRTKVTNAKGEVSYEPSINGTCIAGATGATGKDGINGKDGVNGKSITIKSKAIEYQASTSGTSAPTGTWTTTIPNVNKGSYLWTRTTVTYSDDTNTVSYSVAYRGTDGTDGTNGTNGTNGKDGKGITSITYYYATSTSQTAPSEANVTSTTIPTLNATNKYLWQKEVIKFSDNTNKTSILLIAIYGDKGQTGATGKGVKSIVEQYYLSSSNTTQTGGDWSNTQPNWVNGKYIWTRSHITWSDNTTTDTTPILANGLNNANSTATNAISMADSAKKDVQNTNENLTNNYYTISQTNELVQTAEDGLVNAYTTTGGANIFVNTGLWFVNDNNDQNVNPYEDWKGKALRKSNDEASNGNSILLQNGTFEQEQEVPNGNYSISFMYKKLISQSVASVVINVKEYQLNSTTLKEFYTGEKNEKNEYITEPIVVTAGHLKIQFKCNTNGGVEIYDLMANKGSIKLAYSQNQNETTTETVKISKGITITSTNMETIFKANANGIRILSLQNEKIAYFTDKGLSTKELTVENKAQMCSTLISEVGDQTWFTRM